MNTIALIIEHIPWRKIGALLIVLLICGVAFYKESFLLSSSDKTYLEELSQKTKNKISGRMVVALFGVFLAIVSLLLSYIFYIQK